jgi:hypothetical protein
MATKMYRGRVEKDPGKMIYRQKGAFASLPRARAAQKRLANAGKKAKVIRFTDGYSLYVVASHDFWGRSFIYDRRA